MTKHSRTAESLSKVTDSALRREMLRSSEEKGDCIPFQLGGRTCWAVPASEPRGREPNGKPGEYRVSGWLRIGDQGFLLVLDAGEDSREVEAGEDSPDLWVSLSERETQIAVLVSRGKGTKQIAGHLHISEHTVRSYMRRIFSKLRVSTRAAMVAQLMKTPIGVVELTESKGYSSP